MRKLICLLAITAATFLTTSAFAANQVEVNVTSEPVEQNGLSEKAGGYTMTFDSGTVFTNGDQITIDLPLTVTLSRDIDIVIPTDGLAASNNAAVEQTANATFGGNAAETYFHIHGLKGEQRVNIDVSMTTAADAAATAVSTMTVSATAITDVFTLNFFDQNANGVALWDDSVAGGGNADGVINAAELTAAAPADNTRCIDLSGYSELTVKDSIDSAGDLYIVDPSNPQVAHVVTQTVYSIYSCQKSAVDRISIGEEGGQGGLDSCTAFDFEDSDGYCDSTRTKGKLIVAATKDMAQTTYNVTLTINTAGVYWSNENLGYESYATTAAACADTNAVSASAATDQAGVAAAPVTAGADSCTLAPATKVQTIKVEGVALVTAAGQRALWLDMPAFNYDLSEITAGDDVEVSVNITKDPCGVVMNKTLVVGTLGCVAPGVSQSVTFPYFTEITGDSFWDGFAVTNLSGTDGSADLTIYEADGDVFTATVAVKAHSMAVMNTADLIAIATQTSGTGTMGDARFYMEVNADFNVDGFAMMANPATGESMGYLPRK